MKTRFGGKRKKPPITKAAGSPVQMGASASEWSLEISDKAYEALRDRCIQLSLEIMEKSQLLSDLKKQEKAMLFLLLDAKSSAGKARTGRD